MPLLDTLVTSVEDSKELKMLVFGILGSGKTRFAGTAQLDERTSPVLFLDYEAGTSVLKGLGSNPIRRIGMRRDTAAATWALYDQVFSELSAGDHGYKTVVIDSLSELYQLALLMRTEMAGRKDARVDHLDQDDYGVVGLNIRKFVRRFRDLPMNVIMTSMAMTETDPMRGLISKPALSSSLRNDVPGMFHVVGHLTKANIRTGQGDATRPGRVLYLSDSQLADVKIRLPDGVPDVPYLVDPTVTDLLNILQI